jgi:hypothetical protein
MIGLKDMAVWHLRIVQANLTSLLHRQATSTLKSIRTSTTDLYFVLVQHEHLRLANPLDP